MPNSTCTEDFDTYSFVFNSANLNFPIDRIFLARSENVGGSGYLAIDDVCIEKVDDIAGNYCDCGPVPSTTVYQLGTGFISTVACNGTINLPCPKPGTITRIIGSFPCSSQNCIISPTVAWNLIGPGGGSSGGTSIPSYYTASYDIFLSSIYFQTPGNYTLHIHRQCGGKICKCVIKIIVAPCDCICNSDFHSAVNQGFSVSTISACTRQLQPLALCPNDVVGWSVGASSYSPTTGNNIQQVTFPGPGSYTVCMHVRRFVNGIECGVRENCRTVNVGCGIDPNGTIYKACQVNKLRNGDFRDTAIISGFLNENILLPEWDMALNFGEGRVFVDDSTGSDDEGHVVLIGGRDNFAGIAQEVSLEAADLVTLSYAVKNYLGSEMPTGTRIEFRMQATPFPGDSSQLLYQHEVDTSSNWKRIVIMTDIPVDTSLKYLVICLQNDDSDKRSVIGLDNLELCTDETISTSNVSSTSLLRLYPNPASTSLFVDLPTLSSSDILLQIVNVTGEIILYKDVEETSRQTLNIAKLAPGIYFVQLLSDNLLLSVEKFIKM